MQLPGNEKSLPACSGNRIAIFKEASFTEKQISSFK
jgi:hypothetical protein